jgi:hypothetical protein
MPLDQYFAAERTIRHSSDHPLSSATRGTFFVRSSAPLASLEREVRSIVHAIAPSVPVYDLKTMTERVNDSIYTERLSALLASLFGAVATVWPPLAYMECRFRCSPHARNRYQVSSGRAAVSGLTLGDEGGSNTGLSRYRPWHPNRFRTS